MSMLKYQYDFLAFFDLDGTLCPLAGAIPEKTVLQLRMLEELGCGVVFCSGKPTYYLSAIQRQIGLKMPLIIGENGLMVQIGIDLPPFDKILFNDQDILERSRLLEKKAKQELGDRVWIEPKKTIASLFFDNEDVRLSIKQFLANNKDIIPDNKFDIIEFVDCFDILPKGVDKSLGVQYMQETCGVPQDWTFAMGDGPNDQGMFDASGYAISINNKSHKNIDYLATDTDDAMLHLFKVLFKKIEDRSNKG